MLIANDRNTMTSDVQKEIKRDGWGPSMPAAAVLSRGGIQRDECDRIRLVVPVSPRTEAQEIVSIATDARLIRCDGVLARHANARPFGGSSSRQGVQKGPRFEGDK